MTIEAAIFDLDGTLVSLPIDYTALYAELQKITGIENIEPVTETLATLNDTLKGNAFEMWTKAEFAVLPRMKIVKEGVELYNQYSEVSKVLVTMQGKKTAKRILKTLGLRFQAIISREDSLDRSVQIALALKKLKLKPENAIVIGDRETDKTAAEKLGCKFKMVNQ